MSPRRNVTKVLNRRITAHPIFLLNDYDFAFAGSSEAVSSIR